jgi:Protein of unknown function (DUF3987)
MSKRVPIPGNLKDKYRAEIFNLLSIEPIFEDGKEKARVLTLSHEALNSWVRFSQWIESKHGLGGEFEPIQDWTGKLSGAALRIAGLSHVITSGGDKLTIDKETVERSLDLCELLIPHAKAAFDLMSVDQAVNDAKYVYRWLLARGEDSFERRLCHKSLEGRFRKVERLEKALQILIDTKLQSLVN